MLGFAIFIYTDNSSKTEIPLINRGFWFFTAQPNLQPPPYFYYRAHVIVWKVFGQQISILP